MLEKTKLYFDSFIESEMKEIWEIAKYIHANPEIAFKEHKACSIQCKYLEKAGFKVRDGIEELDTAFVAEYGSGDPVIAILSEYDALKGLGHACGHNLISTSSILTGKAIKKYLEENKVKGTIKVIGTPAEEGGGGKIHLINKGIFDKIDAVFMMHPTSDKTRLAGECLSNMSIEICFKGKSSQAGSHPENGRNALSAANLYLSAVAYWRQHFKSDARVNHYIDFGGEMTNSISDKILVKGEIRSFKLSDLHWINNTLTKCAHYCALAMDCKAEVSSIEGYQGRIPNKTLSDICRQEFIELNEPLLEGMPSDFGGEDLGNVSRIIPICNPYVTIFPDYKISGHTEQFKNLSCSKSGYRCIEITGKALTRTIINVFENPTYIEKAKEELKVRLLEEKNK